jgi:hypothetical protein
MVRGPDQIVACPHCKALARYLTWVSGSLFGVIKWTDGKQHLGGLVDPQPPDIVKCCHCAEYYWLADAKVVGALMSWKADDEQCNPAWRSAPQIEEPAEKEYYEALEQVIAKNPKREKRLRLLAWWSSNDAYRFSGGSVTAPTEARRQNLEALFGLIDDSDDEGRLTKAELLRELGEFESAKEYLSLVASPDVQGVVRQLRDLCNRRERLVKQLSFAESQDIEALIQMLAKPVGRPRLSALRALGEIGSQARVAVPIIVELLRDSDTETVFRARDALRKIGGWVDRGMPVLVDLLNDERYMVRGMAVQFLGEIGPPANSAVPELLAALADENCYVRVNAERALQAIDPGSLHSVRNND